jgi:UDP-N-acetylmuramoylalanine--D-glutamate ligase
VELKNKRVLVVGLGKSGLAAALFLRDKGARVTVSDSRSMAALEKEIPALLDAGIMVEAGGHGLLTFRRQDLIVVSPGVPYDAPELKQVHAYGIPGLEIIGEVELASRFLQGKMVAITGSNGKTTTTALTGKIFADAGVATLVGGNIGVPVIDLVARSTPESWSVLEVSSFQLETIAEFRPSIAVVLNITPDHLDRHGSFENYAAAKARITENQTAEDFLVLNAEDKSTQMVAAKSRAQIFWFSPRRPIKQAPSSMVRVSPSCRARVARPSR